MQALGQQAGSAGLVKVSRHEAAGRFEVGKERYAGTDTVEIFQRELEAEFGGNREEVENGIGRSAGSANAGNGVLERLAGDDGAGPQITAGQLHYPNSRPGRA